jgi:hypothetical protein
MLQDRATAVAWSVQWMAEANADALAGDVLLGYHLDQVNGCMPWRRWLARNRNLLYPRAGM